MSGIIAHNMGLMGSALGGRAMVDDGSIRPENAAAGAAPLDRRTFLQLAASGIAAPLFGTAHVAAAAELRAQGAIAQNDARAVLLEVFRQPPETASPGAYWYWLGGQVSREGITADLEAMHGAGISTPMLFTIGRSGAHSLVQPPVNALTPIWWSLFEHAVQECDRLGMRLSFNDCDGWGTAGGPWITPELSMQRIVWSHSTVSGGDPLRVQVPRPPAKHDFYRDIATVALPWRAEWDDTSQTCGASITTDLPLRVTDAALITDPQNAQQVIDWERVSATHPAWIQYDFPEPFTLRSITVRTPSPPGYAPGVYRAANSLEVQASDDGQTFRRIGALQYPKHGWQTDLTTLTHAVAQTTARHFRLVHHPIAPQPYEEQYDFGQDTRLRLFSIVLCSEPRINDIPGKSGAQWAISRPLTARDVPDDACIALKDIIDLTGVLRADGSLRWTPPAGCWRILRIGCTTTGSMNSAAGAAGGLECDKFSPAVAKLQFDRWFGQALARVGPRLAGRVLHIIHVDSWEAGAQNWSPDFAAGFHRLRGYDLMPYIAVMTGVPLVSADVSERVLHDVRRTINDLMDAGFFRTIGDLAHEHGCIFSAEPPNPTFPADGMEHFKYVDQPMGEFWLNTPRNDKPTDIKDAVNAARLYHKPFAQAESFTEGLITWAEHPYLLKALGDHNYCQGIGRLFLHVYAHQPWLHRSPGITLDGIGTFFGRTQTWWQPARAWFDYLRRCQALLQQGRAVTDVCYFNGENIPARSFLRWQLPDPPPLGYEFDTINRDALLRLAGVNAARIELSTGPRYRVLVLPDSPALTPEVATRLSDLVHAGAVVVGPPPRCSPSLTDFPAADTIVRQVAEDLWGDLDGVQRTDRSVGSGRVIWGQPLGQVLESLGVPPDVDCSIQDGTIQWTHRAGPDWDLYFVSHQSPCERRVELTLRVSGKIPELWHPDTGAIESLAMWHESDGRTTIELRMDPNGSVFILFATPADDRRVVGLFAQAPDSSLDAVRLARVAGMIQATVAQPGSWLVEESSGARALLEVGTVPAPLFLQGPWTLTFQERLAAPLRLQLDALVSWTELRQAAARYFSGTAEYVLEFVLPAELMRPEQRLQLDLGTVHELVAVQLNGTDLGVLWKPPFMIDITAVALSGHNVLRCQVTNTWRNRIIGDHGKPAAERTTFIDPMLRLGKPWLPGGSGTTLSPAGLLGPVSVRAAIVRTL